MSALEPDDDETIKFAQTIRLNGKTIYEWREDCLILLNDKADAEKRNFCQNEGSNIELLNENPDHNDINYSATADKENRISERRLADNALRASEEHHRQLFDINPHPMWFFDKETLVFLAVNDAAIVHYGWSREEFLAMTLMDIHPPEDIPALLKYLATDNEKAIRFIKSVTHRKKDGTLIDVEIRSHDVNFDGRRARIASAYDISEQKHAEKALLQSEERYRSLFSQAMDGILLFDMEGNVVSVNDSFAHMHGHSIDELLKINLHELDTPETLALSPERYARIRAGESIRFEVEHFHKDGHIVPLNVASSMVEIDGKLNVLAFHRDITEQKLAMQALKRSQQELRALSKAANEAI